MIKLVVLDLDGTLLDSSSKIRPGVLEAVYRVKDMGVLVTIATGRSYMESARYIYQLGVEIPVAVQNGAVIRKPDGEVLISRTLDLAASRHILDASGGHSKIMRTFTSLATGRIHVDKRGPKKYIDALCKETEYLVLEEDLPASLTHSPVRVTLFGEQEYLDQLDSRLSGELANVNVYRWTMVDTVDQASDFIDSQATKAAAVRHLAAHFSIKPTEILAIGDDVNDAELLDYAGTSVLMSNGKQTLHSVADYVAPPNDEEGVAAALWELIIDAALPRRTRRLRPA